MPNKILSQVSLPALCVVAAAGVATALPASAQNLGGVFPAVVNDGHKSAQYRIAYNADAERHAQRIHYQQSVNDDLMWRVVAQGRETADSDLDFDFVQGELFWQISDNDKPWITGMRFDVRLRDDDRPSQIGINFQNQFNFGNGWEGRAVGLTSFELGGGAKDGVALLTRGQLTKKLDGGPKIGVELYNSYGRSNDILDFEDQNHTFGPIIVGKFGNGWSYFAGSLFGLTDGSADSDHRIWITKSF